MYQTSHFYISNSSNINYIHQTHQLYISVSSTIYIRPIHYIYQTHQLYISDPSTIYNRPIVNMTHQIYHSHPLYIHITPIHYRYQTNIYVKTMQRWKAMYHMLYHSVTYIVDETDICIYIILIHYICQNHATMKGDVSYVMTATIYDMTKTK